MHSYCLWGCHCCDGNWRMEAIRKVPFWLWLSRMVFALVFAPGRNCWTCRIRPDGPRERRHCVQNCCCVMHNRIFKAETRPMLKSTPRAHATRQIGILTLLVSFLQQQQHAPPSEEQEDDRRQACVPTAARSDSATAFNYSSTEALEKKVWLDKETSVDRRRNVGSENEKWNS